jgi:hypothetical protein
LRRWTSLALIVGALVVSTIRVLRWRLSWLSYFRQISHGLVAATSGGGAERIELNWDGSGTCYYRRGPELAGGTSRAICGRYPGVR